jgi:hypothetical protein
MECVGRVLAAVLMFSRLELPPGPAFSHAVCGLAGPVLLALQIPPLVLEYECKDTLI